MNIPATPALLLAIALLAGCAGPGGIVPQHSTIMQVRDRMGIPTDIRFDRNSDELWEYARGPMGTETYLFRAGKDGRVKEVTQLLTQDRFARIVPLKTDKAEVRDLLGRPSDQSFFGGEAVWEWRVRVDPQLGRFIVRFNRDDVVREAMLLIDPSEGDRDRDRGSRGSRGGRGGRD